MWGTRTPHRMPQVSRLRAVFGSAILRNRSRRVDGMKTLRRSCPFSRYAKVNIVTIWKREYSRLRIVGNQVPGRAEESVLESVDQVIRVLGVLAEVVVRSPVVWEVARGRLKGFGTVDVQRSSRTVAVGVGVVRL